MEHLPNNQGLDQISHISADDWEQFFVLCLEFVAIARERRAAAIAKNSDTDLAQAESTPATNPRADAAHDVF